MTRHGLHLYNITLLLNREQESRRLTTNSHGAIVKSVMEVVALRHARVFCWVVMPDHIHLLFARHNRLANVDKFAGRVKRMINERLQSRGLHIMAWRDGCIDYPIVWADLERTRTYILNNPVRAGIVSGPAEYGLSGTPALLPSQDEVCEGPCDEEE